MTPNGWTEPKIHALPGQAGRPVTKLGPFGSALKKSDYTDCGYKVYGQQQVLAGDEDHGDYWVGESKYRELIACSVEPGDILLSTMGSFGSILRLSEASRPGIINPRLLRLSISHDHAVPRYVEQFLQSDLAKRQFHAFAQGGTMPAINGASIGALKILLPPLGEQKKIAEILSTWDQAIVTAEDLIENGAKQRRALMQQLLSGKRRMPGFGGDWQERSLDEVFQFKKGQGLSKADIDPCGRNPCILYGELYTCYPEIVEYAESRTNSESGVVSRFGDILIPASTTTTGIDLANATALMQAGVQLSGDINILRPKRVTECSPFYAYLLTHHEKRKIAARAQGITIIHLYGKHLKPLKVKVPSVEEQNAIANVLMATDRELGALRAQLANLKRQKKALMQQLMTGRRRVKLDGDV
ncbi:restriction endonuclease subunit S [Ruegeria atlantica]|uniref:restriction endonuclease subunit S n=1 Tax=Ruegeria atlantica TaxID=81569 RepID=UPI00147D2D44|nr:restriction endonuclease subunit S [Ruegeria atlantica]